MKPFGLQRLEDLLPVRLVARLHRHVQLGALGGHVQKKPAMIDSKNVGAKLAEPGGNVAKHAGTVRDGQAQGDDAVFPLQLADHDRSENAWVDVATTQDQ